MSHAPQGQPGSIMQSADGFNMSRRCHLGSTVSGRAITPPPPPPSLTPTHTLTPPPPPPHLPNCSFIAHLKGDKTRKRNAVLMGGIYITALFAPLVTTPDRVVISLRGGRKLIHIICSLWPETRSPVTYMVCGPTCILMYVTGNEYLYMFWVGFM